MNENYRDDEIEIDLGTLLFELLGHWKMICLSAILTGLIGLVLSLFVITPQYESTSELYVLSKSTSITSLADIQMGTNLTNDYMVVVKGRPVLEQVISNLNIKVISDTVANDIYYDEPFYFVPQQSGKARKMPFRLTTFCYHPNIMQDNDFEELEQFIKENESCFVQFSLGMMRKRRISCIDKIYRFLYFARREINCKLTKRER